VAEITADQVHDLLTGPGLPGGWDQPELPIFADLAVWP
jgi:hypothetical protein